jgi:cytoskeletal protein CcmA (bactofilin family)
MGETVIGKSLIIDGEVKGTEPLIVQGTIKGKITLDNKIFVAEGGRIEAHVLAGVVEVSGAVNGNVEAAERLEIKTGGRMHGDIRSPRILISDGALYKGNIDMESVEVKLDD